MTFANLNAWIYLTQGATKQTRVIITTSAASWPQYTSVRNFTKHSRTPPVGGNSPKFCKPILGEKLTILNSVFGAHNVRFPQHIYKMSASSSTSASPLKTPENKEESSGKQEEKAAPPPPAQQSNKEKLKQAVRDYGATVLVFHISMSLMSLGFFYLLVQSGLDVVAILAKLGISESILQSKATEEAGKFVVAYAVHKVFAPARIAITLTATPLIVRKLRSMGILKEIKPKS